jgi:hypothetical protein
VSPEQQQQQALYAAMLNPATMRPMNVYGASPQAPGGGLARPGMQQFRQQWTPGQNQGGLQVAGQQQTPLQQAMAQQAQQAAQQQGGGAS